MSLLRKGNVTELVTKWGNCCSISLYHLYTYTHTNIYIYIFIINETSYLYWINLVVQTLYFIMIVIPALQVNLIKRGYQLHYNWCCHSDISVHFLLLAFSCVPRTPIHILHYSDVIMSTMVSQITGVSMVCSTVYSGADERKHQSSTSLAFVRRIHRFPL